MQSVERSKLTPLVGSLDAAKVRAGGAACDAHSCYNTFMRITIELPDDIHEKVAVDALKRRRNSKEAVIADILRAHYGGGTRDALTRRALGWRIDRSTGLRIAKVRRRMKDDWK